MFVLILVIGILFLLTSATLYLIWVNNTNTRADRYSPYALRRPYRQIICWLNTIGGILAIGGLMMVITFGGICSSYSNYDNRLEIYTQENKQIEQEISAIVSKYQSYEGEVFKECASPTALIQMYPELKSDTMVQKQIDLYIANNQEIKNLKISKTYLNIYKWWLYFGGGE